MAKMKILILASIAFSIDKEELEKYDEIFCISVPRDLEGRRLSKEESLQEAMAEIDELAERFPRHEIYVFLNEYGYLKDEIADECIKKGYGIIMETYEIIEKLCYSPKKGCYVRIPKSKGWKLVYPAASKTEKLLSSIFKRILGR